LVDQLEIGVVNKGGRLDGMAVTLAPEQPGGRPAEVRVDEGEQGFYLLAVALRHVL
jgi:hypothetical protein